MPYYSESALYWHHVKKVCVVPACSIKSFIMQAVRQVVFTDVLIVGRLDVDGQSFAPIGLHKIDANMLTYRRPLPLPHLKFDFSVSCLGFNNHYTYTKKMQDEKDLLMTAHYPKVSSPLCMYESILHKCCKYIQRHLAGLRFVSVV